MQYRGRKSLVMGGESANWLAELRTLRPLQKKSGPEVRSSFLMRTSLLHSAAVRQISIRQPDRRSRLLRHG